MFQAIQAVPATLKQPSSHFTVMKRTPTRRLFLSSLVFSSFKSRWPLPQCKRVGWTKIIQHSFALLSALPIGAIAADGNDAGTNRTVLFREPRPIRYVLVDPGGTNIPMGGGQPWTRARLESG